MTEPFNVDAVLRKWGFTRNPQYGESPFWPGFWSGTLDSREAIIPFAAAYVFANQLLMRN